MRTQYIDLGRTGSGRSLKGGRYPTCREMGNASTKTRERMRAAREWERSPFARISLFFSITHFIRLSLFHRCTTLQPWMRTSIIPQRSLDYVSLTHPTWLTLHQPGTRTKSCRRERSYWIWRMRRNIFQTQTKNRLWPGRMLEMGCCSSL